MGNVTEQELIKASKFKPPKGSHDRQDHLAGLAKVVNKLTDEQFDELSDDAANWVSAAILAINKRTEIKDFEDADEADETSDEEAVEADGEEGAEEPSDDSDDEPADEPEPDGDGDDTEAAANSADAKAEAENEAEEAAEEAKPKKPAKKAAKPTPKKPVAMAVDEADEKTPSKDKNKKVVVTRYDNLTGEKDRFGVVMGTKTHDAVLLYEKGVTTAELKRKLQGRFYNILRILEDKGHRVERQPGGIFKLTHMDDVTPKGKGKK